jgi:FixJ family two-component response regulator
MNADTLTAGATQQIVYVIDDDESVRNALEDLLASVGLTVRSFGSTQEFLSGNTVDAPGCLVLDVRMPGQSGLDFQRQMADLGIRLPVIFITGYGDIAMSVRAMKNGAIEFLTKPFHDQDLLDAIQQGIEKDRVRREEDRIVSDLQSRWQTLTAGERDVMDLVVQGLLQASRCRPERQRNHCESPAWADYAQISGKISARFGENLGQIKIMIVMICDDIYIARHGGAFLTGGSVCGLHGDPLAGGRNGFSPCRQGIRATPP